MSVVEETCIGEFFLAAYDLNIDKLKLFLNKLNINSVNQVGAPDEHILQSFGSFRSGKVICQVFEKIDTLKTTELKIVLQIIQLLVSRGLILEEIMFDRQNNEFSEEDTAFFWFSVLKKIYRYSLDPAKNESEQSAYMSLASYLEESLFQGCEQYGRIPRTARLHLAVDEGDHETLQKILGEFTNKSYFQIYMRAIPGELFPIGSYNEDTFQVTPVGLGLHRKDVRSLNILVEHPISREPIFKGKSIDSSRQMIVSLLLEILHDDPNFFDRDNLIRWDGSADIDDLIVAKVFRCVENNNLRYAKELLNSPEFPYLERLKNTYALSKLLLLDSKDLEEERKHKNYFEKSLVYVALENKNSDMLDYLEEGGFDITRLGNETLYPTNDQEQNNMFLWYLLIKHHLQNGNQHFLFKLSQNSKIMEGPAIVGCLFMAAKQEDWETIQLIYNFFESSWFAGSKYKGMTAHSLLLKHDYRKQAAILLQMLCPQIDLNQNVESELDKAESIGEFKILIQANPQWLMSQQTDKENEEDFPLLTKFITSSQFTIEKFRYLLKVEDVHIFRPKNKTFVDFLIHLCDHNYSKVQRILNVMQHSEVQDVFLASPGFLADITTKILESSESVRAILIEVLKMTIEMPTQTLESLFFTESTLEGFNIFKVIQKDTECFNIVAERAFKLIGKEENKLTVFVNLLKAQTTSVFSVPSSTGFIQEQQEKELLSLFQYFFDKLNMNMRYEVGYRSALDAWRDGYGMTFLMRLLGDNSDSVGSAPAVDILIEKILEGEFFEEEYIHNKAEVDLGAQYDLQHRLGITSANKKKNTVISKDQLITAKRVIKFNSETGQYEAIVPDKANQVKVMTKERVKVIDDGPERKTRVMVTVRDPNLNTQTKIDEETKISGNTSIDGNASSEEEIGNSLEFDKDSTDGNASLDEGSDQCLDFDRGSMDGNASYEESGDDFSSLGFSSEDELDGDTKAKVDKWNLGQKEIKDRIVEPEHFDKTSFLTRTNETFVTKNNKYKFAPSALTRFIETYSEVEAPAQDFVKNTTLLLMACKSSKWTIVSIILDFYDLLVDVNHKDANGSNALHLAINADQIDICNKMITTVTSGIAHILKSEVNADGKNALMLVTDKIIEDGNIEFESVEKNILKTTGQKNNPYRKPTSQASLAKSQKIQLFQGKSCGYNFEYQEPNLWICTGDNCNVLVWVEEDFNLSKNGHYDKDNNAGHTCKTQIGVKHRKGKIVLDQFQFSYIKDVESNAGEVIEAWKCTKDGCESIIELNVKTELVESHGLHNCFDKLELELEKECGLLDGYVFSKDQESKGKTSIWSCTGLGCREEKKGCKIAVAEDDLKLRQLHTREMHLCNDYKQSDNEDGSFIDLFGDEADDGGQEEEDDGDMFRLFD